MAKLLGLRGRQRREAKEEERWTREKEGEGGIERVIERDTQMSRDRKKEGEGGTERESDRETHR